MGRFIFGVILGLLLALVVAQPAVAQAAMRIFGTLSTGNPQAIIVDTTGAVSVAIQ